MNTDSILYCNTTMEVCTNEKASCVSPDLLHRATKTCGKCPWGGETLEPTHFSSVFLLQESGHKVASGTTRTRLHATMDSHVRSRGILWLYLVCALDVW